MAKTSEEIRKSVSTLNAKYRAKTLEKELKELRKRLSNQGDKGVLNRTLRLIELGRIARKRK